MINVPGMPDGMISIHALRGEGDLQDLLQYIMLRAISIHALRGEGDTQIAAYGGANKVFQSTPSVGRATNRGQTFHRSVQISIHALRGEGDASCRAVSRKTADISIHALRGEGDL